MAVCEVCGNDYDMTFEVLVAGHRHVFDRFECAVHALGRVCEHCGSKVLVRGIRVEGRFFCCAHCVRQDAKRLDVRDRSRMSQDLLVDVIQLAPDKQTRQARSSPMGDGHGAQASIITEHEEIRGSG